MGYGLAINDLNGNVLLAEKAPLALFVGKAVLDRTNTSTLYTHIYRLYVAQNPMPTCFVHIPFGYGLQYVYCDWVTSWACYRVTAVTNCPSAPTIYAFINSMGLGASGVSHGLRLYTDSGYLFFDSGWGKFATVHTVAAVPNYDGAVASYVYTSKPAILYQNGYVNYIRSAGREYYYHRLLRVYNQNTLVVDRTLTYNKTTSLSDYQFLHDPSGVCNTFIMDAAQFD